VLGPILTPFIEHWPGYERRYSSFQLQTPQTLEIRCSTDFRSVHFTSRETLLLGNGSNIIVLVFSISEAALNAALLERQLNDN
jgi:hypothetical protein